MRRLWACQSHVPPHAAPCVCSTHANGRPAEVPAGLFLDAAFFVDTAGPVPTPGTAPGMQRPRGPCVWLCPATPAGWQRAGLSGQGQHSRQRGREALGQCSAHGGLGSRVCKILKNNLRTLILDGTMLF